MIYVLWVLSLVCLYYFMKNREKNRISELVNLIDQLDKKNYSIPMKQDDFAILEDQIYKLFLKIVEEKDEVKRLSKNQIENLENIAHQIKTPITNMLFSLETLEEENNSKEIKKLSFQLKRLNSLADILLKLSSLDMQVNNMKSEKIYLEEIFDYALDILDKDIENKEIEILDNYNGLYIWGDFYWLSEAFINILKNSINLKNCSRIKIFCQDNPLFTKISIEDNGGGIEKEYFSKIFKRFYKTPDSNGFGIGLAMTKTIVENNNGEIEVENGKEGAIFHIKFYKLAS